MPIRVNLTVEPIRCTINTNAALTPEMYEKVAAPLARAVADAAAELAELAGEYAMAADGG